MVELVYQLERTLVYTHKERYTNMNTQDNTVSTVDAPSILWALVSKTTGKVRSFSPTREEARQKKTENYKVLRYVADFSARA